MKIKWSPYIRRTSSKKRAEAQKSEHDEYKLPEEFINSKGNKILSHKPEKAHIL